MKIYCLQHVVFEGPSWISSWAKQNHITLKITRLYQNTNLASLDDFDGLVVMGGPMGVGDEDVYPWLAAEKKLIAQTIKANKPVLGICLGAQLVASVLGAKVSQNPQKEIGWFPVQKTKAAQQCYFDSSLPNSFTALHWHGDTFEIPEGAIHLAKSAACENQAFSYRDNVLGLQFHLEATKQSTLSLINNCGEELVPAPMIQSEEEIIEGFHHFESTHVLIDRLLKKLFKLA